MSKISELSDGGSLQSTDYLIAVRSGGNVKVQADGAVSGTTGQFSTSLNVDGTVTADGLTVEGTNGNFEVATTGNSVNMTRGGNNFITASNAVGDLFLGAGGVSFLKIDNTGDISFYEDTGTTPKFFWDASAEALGIGTSSPDTALHVSSSSGTKATFERTGATGSYIGLKDSSGSFVYLGGNSGVFEVQTPGSSYSTKLAITSAGNVGIGTDSPATKLELSGSNSGSTSDNPAATLRLTDTDGSTAADQPIGKIEFFGNDGTVPSTNVMAYILSKAYSASGGGDLRFGVCTNSVAGEAMRLNASGALLVGETSSTPYGGLTTTHVFKGSSTNPGGAPFGIYNSSGTAEAPVLNLLNRDTSTDSSNRFLQFYANVTSTTNQSMGGIVGNGANNVQFATISDAREKTNIQNIGGSLEKINALNPVEFDWIASGEHVNAGFVAQEVEQVFPEFVVENMAGEGQEARKGLTGGMTGGIVAHLVKAIQEQQEIINDLRARVAQLEGA